MSTFDVPGANPANKDVLTPGCWAERSDGRMLLVEKVEDGQVSYLAFNINLTITIVGIMPEDNFKEEFTWKPPLDSDGDYEEEELVWIWHSSSSKRPFPFASFSIAAN